MNKREKTSNDVDLSFDNIVQPTENIQENVEDATVENKFINVDNTPEVEAFPFEGDAIESQEEIQKADSDIFEMPIVDEATPVVEEAPTVEEALNEDSKEKEELPGVEFETTLPEMNVENTEETETPVEENMEEEIASETEEIIEAEEPKIEYDEANDLDLNDKDSELIDFESIIKELSDDIIGANNVATEINEKREYLKKAETEFLEQKEEFEQEKEKFKKKVTEENESIELKRAECDEYIKKQKKHMEEAEAQFKATVQTKEKEFDDLKKQLEEERKKLNQEKMDFAVEKASAEEKVRNEREELQKENEYLTNSSNKLKQLIEQFNSVSKQITD